MPCSASASCWPTRSRSSRAADAAPPLEGRAFHGPVRLSRQDLAARAGKGHGAAPLDRLHRHDPAESVRAAVLRPHEGFRGELRGLLRLRHHRHAPDQHSCRRTDHLDLCRRRRARGTLRQYDCGRAECRDCRCTPRGRESLRRRAERSEHEIREIRQQIQIRR